MASLGRGPSSRSALTRSGIGPGRRPTSFCRLRGYNTLYICGTDEYGTATETKVWRERCMGSCWGSLLPTALLTVDGSRAAHTCVGAARGCDLPGDLRQVPRLAPRHLQVVRHFVRPVWPDHHAAPDHVLPLHAQHARSTDAAASHVHVVRGSRPPGLRRTSSTSSTRAVTCLRTRSSSCGVKRTSGR